MSIRWDKTHGNSSSLGEFDQSFLDGIEVLNFKNQRDCVQEKILDFSSITRHKCIATVEEKRAECIKSSGFGSFNGPKRPSSRIKGSGFRR